MVFPSVPKFDWSSEEASDGGLKWDTVVRACKHFGVQRAALIKSDSLKMVGYYDFEKEEMTPKWEYPRRLCLTEDFDIIYGPEWKWRTVVSYWSHHSDSPSAEDLPLDVERLCLLFFCGTHELGSLMNGGTTHLSHSDFARLDTANDDYIEQGSYNLSYYKYIYNTKPLSTGMRRWRIQLTPETGGPGKILMFGRFFYVTKRDQLFGTFLIATNPVR